jgi:hypothetical protein
MNKRMISLCLLMLIASTAFGLRLRAARLLPIDYDEDDYLAAAIHYARAIKARDLREISDYAINFEHPPLAKLVYGLAIAPMPNAPVNAEYPQAIQIAASLPEPHFRISRLVSVVFGSLQVLVLGLVNPLAGLFLAIHTWQIKYTSQIMLEPLPALTGLLVVYFYSKSNRRGDVWLYLSAVVLGLTAAAKYPYTMAGCAILVHWISADWKQLHDGRKKHLLAKYLPVIVWAAIALITFACFNPRLWHDPINRLWASLMFHRTYAQSEHVRQVGFPFWQPLVWIFRPVPWHPGVFLISVDALISLLAVFGVRRLWQSYRVYALWLGFTLAFLLLWPTKWPQYILGFTAPLSLSAALGFAVLVVEPVKAGISSLGKLIIPTPTNVSARWYNK